MGREGPKTPVAASLGLHLMDNSRSDPICSLDAHLFNTRTRPGRGRGKRPRALRPVLRPLQTRTPSLSWPRMPQGLPGVPRASPRAGQSRPGRSPLPRNQTAPETSPEARAGGGRQGAIQATCPGARGRRESPGREAAVRGSLAVPPPGPTRVAPRMDPPAPAGGGAAPGASLRRRARRPRPAGGGPAPRPTCGKERAGRAREGPRGGGRGIQPPARAHWLRCGRAGPARPTIGCWTWVFACGPGAGRGAGGGARGPRPPQKLGREPATAPRRGRR